MKIIRIYRDGDTTAHHFTSIPTALDWLEHLLERYDNGGITITQPDVSADELAAMPVWGETEPTPFTTTGGIGGADVV